MTFLEELIRARFPDQRTRVERLASGRWRASVDYSEMDLALSFRDMRRGYIRDLLSPLEMKPRRRRRLHWGRRR